MPAILATHLHAIFIKGEIIVSIVVPGMSLFPAAADILEVSILQTATRVPVILVEIPVHVVCPLHVIVF